MTLKRIIIIFILTIFCVGMKAQNTPSTVTIQVEEFEYKKAGAGKVALNILSAVANPEHITTQAKTLAPQINQAILAATSGKPWLRVMSGHDATPDYRLKGTITNASNGTGKMTDCSMIVIANIVDCKTNKTIASKLCKGYGFTYDTVDAGRVKAVAANLLTKSVAKFIMEAIPVTGSVLDKGVEQANGKVKENQCYVDLGTMHGIQKGTHLYVVDGSKYKAELKVNEIMGDDLCSCKISSGKSYIEKCLQKGASIVVTSKPKKIKDD